MLVKPTSGPDDLKRFIELPFRLPDQRPNRVPPLLMDEREFHDPAKNPQLAHCEVERWIACRDGHAVGRIMGIIHRGYNAAHGERTARFYNLDCVRDTAVVRALIGPVEAWARGKGMDRVIGPFGFSDKDPQGLQIEGFEHLPVIATPTNPDWLPAMVEARGYAPFEDTDQWRGSLEDATDDLVRQIIRTNSYLQAQDGQARREQIDDQASFSVALSGRSPVTGQEERVTVVTRSLTDGDVIYALCIVPGRGYDSMTRTFTQMLRTLNVNDDAIHRGAQTSSRSYSPR